VDLYTIVKFLHILTAVAWVGGAILLFVASEVAQRSPGPVFGGFSAIAAQLGNLFFIPVALSTLVLGIILTVMSWSFADLWIILALAGIAVSIAFGIVIIKPTTDRIAGIAKTEGPDSPQVRALSAGLLHKGRFDLVLMVVIVADMVFKPGYGDVLTLSIMAAVLAVAILTFLVRQPQLPVRDA
jgi:uncharacterized membrane protein